MRKRGKVSHGVLVQGYLYKKSQLNVKFGVFLLLESMQMAVFKGKIRKHVLLITNITCSVLHCMINTDYIMVTSWLHRGYVMVISC